MSTAELSNVRRICQKFADAGNAHDIEAFASLFCVDADFVDALGTCRLSDPCHAVARRRVVDCGLIERGCGVALGAHEGKSCPQP